MPERRTEVRIIEQAARKHGIDPATLWGLYGAETNFGKNKNVSSAGAQGPFQFMPGTAKSYGIDPHNFRQAANAAAKYLSTYKSRGTAGMLAAYNAGPAGNPNNAETRAYIPKVKQLSKTWPGGSRIPRSTGARGGSQNPRSRGQIPETQGSQFDAGAAPPLSMALQAMSQPRPVAQASGIAPPSFAAGGGTPLSGGWSPGPNSDQTLDTLLSGLRDQGQTLPTIDRGEPSQGPQSKPGRSRAPSVGGGKLPNGKIAEMFYDKGISMNDGKRVGPIGGHGSHVHVGGDPALMVALGRRAQKMGLAVRENPVFDKVDPVHSKNSFHYRTDKRGRGGAIDVSGDPKKLAAFNRRVARLAR